MKKVRPLAFLWLSFSLLLLLCLSPRISRADGKVFGRTEIDPATPFQEAVIIRDGGTECMILRIEFNGEGDDFAWVVPVPSTPTINLERPYIFLKLRGMAAPEIITTEHNDYPVLVFVFFVIAVAYLATKGIIKIPWPWLRDLLLLICGLLLMFALQLAVQKKNIQISPLGPMSTGSSLKVLAEESLGIYDTVTLKSENAAELKQWLEQNGYAVHGDPAEVFDHYINKGWVFVGVKLNSKFKGKHQEDKSRETPPLSFTFKSNELIFPLKITSLSGQKSLVMLYIVSEDKAGMHKADIEGFETAFYYPVYLRELGITFPLRRENVILTRLWANLDSHEMEDATIRFVEGPRYFIDFYYTRQVKYFAITAIILCLATLVIIWAVKSRVVFQLLFSIIAIWGLQNFGTLVSLTKAAPFTYNQVSGVGFENADRTADTLKLILRHQQAFVKKNGRPAVSFSELGYTPTLDHATFYLSGGDFFPPQENDPYGFLFDETGALKCLGEPRRKHYDNPPINPVTRESGYVAVGFYEYDDGNGVGAKYVAPKGNIEHCFIP